MKRVIAMILAGGRGKRMDILCHGRAKPALPFAGMFRVIDFSLSNCINSQISDIAVLVDYHRSNMANYLRKWQLVNTDLRSLHTLAPKAGSYYRGTADAVYRNLDFLRRHDSDKVLILAGDHVYKMDYRKMLAFHEQVKADLTVGVISVRIEEAHRFGIVTLDKDRIIDFVEKPRIPQSNLTSMGIYIFNKQVLTECLVEDAAQPDSPHDFGYAVVPAMVRRHKVFAYKFHSYWKDIGTIGAYYEANMELTCQQPSFNLDSTWPIFTGTESLILFKKSPQGSIKNSLVSPGCVIEGDVKNSVLSPGVRVEEEAVVRNSVLMPNVVVGRHSVIDNCVLDEEVKIGEFCHIGYGATLISGEWDTTVLGRGVTVPPRTAIGRGCKILPGVDTADFATNIIPSGTIVAHRSESKP